MRPEEPVANRPSTYLEALSMLDAVVAERDELRQRVSRLKRLMRRLVSEWLIRKAVKDGDLAAASIGTKRYRISAHAIDQWLTSQPQEPK